MERIGINKPDPVSYRIRIQKIYIINLEPIFDSTRGIWTWIEVELSPGLFNYEDAVLKLVSEKFPEGKILEIALGDHDSIEYKMLQCWRDEAKRIAREAEDYINEHDL